MFLYNVIEFTPKKALLFPERRPGRMFKRFLQAVSLGSKSRDSVNEACAATLVLQHLYQGLATLGVTNIVRLACDDLDFYFDESGKDDDFHQALFQFAEIGKKRKSSDFDSLFLVLEHTHDDFEFLIQIRLNRRSDLARSAVQIQTHGLFREFTCQDEPESVGFSLKRIMSDQTRYEQFIDEKRRRFNDFVGRLLLKMQETFALENLESESKPVIIRSRSFWHKPKPFEHGNPCDSPLFQDYYNWDKVVFYCLIWMNHMREHGITGRFYLIIDDQGRPLLHVDGRALTAQERLIFDVGRPFKGKLLGSLPDEVIEPGWDLDGNNETIMDAIGINSVSQVDGRRELGYMLGPRYGRNSFFYRMSDFMDDLYDNSSCSSDCSSCVGD